jgi:hypothetical protein
LKPLPLEAQHESANAQDPRNELSARSHQLAGGRLRWLFRGLTAKPKAAQPRPPQPPPALLLQNSLVNYAFLNNRQNFSGATPFFAPGVMGIETTGDNNA